MAAVSFAPLVFMTRASDRASTSVWYFGAFAPCSQQRLAFWLSTSCTATLLRNPWGSIKRASLAWC